MSSKKKASAYDELRELHTTSVGLVTELERTVATYRQVGVGKVKDPDAVESVVTTIERDIEEYRGKIDKIYNDHKDWQGRPKRPNQFIACHTIGNDYLNIVESIVSATMPLTVEVIAAIEEGVTHE